MLGIARGSAGLTGWDAPKLWQRYEMLGDQAALQLLLDYNRDDVVNLAVLEDKIGLSTHPTTHTGIQQVFA
jgi:uncharacterized protein YprB with RNaseH-like and TPR domain